MFAELAGALAGGALAGALGGGGKSQPLYYTPDFVNEMNRMLDESLGKALQTTKQYTDQAVGEVRGGVGSANTALADYLKQALSQSQMFANKGLQNYQTLQKPYAQTGYDALDAYKQTLGLNTPQGGSAAQVEAAQQAQQLLPLLQQFKSSGYQAPTAPTMAANPDMNQLKTLIGQPAINDWITNSLAAKRESGGNILGLWAGEALPYLKHGQLIDVRHAVADPLLQDRARTALAQSNYNNILQANQSNYNQANQQYQGQMNQFNDATGAINKLTPQQQQAVAYQLRSLL